VELWDKIKTYPNWENEIAADIKVEKTDIYGVYTVKSGDTLSKIAKAHFGDAKRYMEIFNANKDILTNPDLIKVGQKLKIPNK
jgi:nucleoid-associated protein YgaU